MRQGLTEMGVPTILRAVDFAEAPGFRVGNFAANLRREVPYTNLTDLEIPPAPPVPDPM